MEETLEGARGSPRAVVPLGWMDGLLGGWMDGWVDGWMNG